MKAILVLALMLGLSSFAKAAAYDSFIFYVEGDCQDQHSVWFHYAFAWDPVIFGKDVTQKDLQAWVGLQLFKDGTYWAEYGEDAVKETQGGESLVDPVFRKSGLTGKWSIAGDKIEIAGLGFGLPTTYTKSDGSSVTAIQFMLTQPVHDARVVSQKMGLIMSPTDLGPKGISVAQYCAK